jgi:hypothetical protein
LHLLGEDERALEEIRRSRRVFPSDSSLMHVEAAVLAALGRETELRRLEAEARITANYGFVLIDVSAEQLMHGDTARGRASARKAIDWFRIQPAADSVRYREPLFFARLLGGRRDELREYVTLPCDSLAIDCWTRRGVAAAFLGDTITATAAAATIERLNLTPPQRQAAAAISLASIHAALGDEDRAVGFIRDAFSKGQMWGGPTRALVVPFPRLQAHEGFRELMRPKG